MFIKDTVKNLLPIHDFNNLYVVADFDRTITTGDSMTSWSILASSDLVPKSYIKERQELYEKYRPIEIDTTLPFDYRMEMMSEWFRKHIELFVKYQMSEEIFEKAATDLRVMQFRKGAQEFLSLLHQKQVPLIIISAGIGNFIETFLKINHCYFDNIYVSSNKVLFENGIAVGVGENIIHSLNKNEVSLPTEITKKLQNRNQIILLGDQVSDLNMVDKKLHNNVISVGFISEEASRSCSAVEDLKASYDIVCETDEGYDSLKEIFSFL